jgi:pre-rRNA-processing protein TSR4
MIEECKPSVLLGFVVDPVYDLAKSKLYTPFECRAGGSPAWLVPVLSGLPRELRCLSCQRLLSFLLQLYAPRERHPAAFHRVIYVLVCAWCAGQTPTPPGALRVYRAQLPRQNSWYPMQVDDVDSLRRGFAKMQAAMTTSDTINASPEHFTSGAAMGAHGLATTRCVPPNTSEPEETHQDATLKRESPPNGNTFAKCWPSFPTIEITVGSDDDSDAAEDDELASNDEGMESSEEHCLDDSKNSLDDGEVAKTISDWSALIASVENDQQVYFPHFSDSLVFEQALGSHRDQVLRYVPFSESIEASFQKEPKRIAEVLGEQILWFGSGAKLASALVPVCPRCGDPRLFEFQVMPQLIYYLCRTPETTDDVSDAAASWKSTVIDANDPRAVLDFSTIVVWTCPRDCFVSESVAVQKESEVPSRFYLEEFAYVQPVSDK